MVRAIPRAFERQVGSQQRIRTGPSAFQQAPNPTAFTFLGNTGRQLQGVALQAIQEEENQRIVTEATGVENDFDQFIDDKWREAQDLQDLTGDELVQHISSGLDEFEESLIDLDSNVRNEISPYIERNKARFISKIKDLGKERIDEKAVVETNRKLAITENKAIQAINEEERQSHIDDGLSAIAQVGAVTDMPAGQIQAEMEAFEKQVRNNAFIADYKHPQVDPAEVIANVDKYQFDESVKQDQIQAATNYKEALERDKQQAIDKAEFEADESARRGYGSDFIALQDNPSEAGYQDLQNRINADFLSGRITESTRRSYTSQTQAEMNRLATDRNLLLDAKQARTADNMTQDHATILYTEDIKDNPLPEQATTKEYLDRDLNLINQYGHLPQQVIDGMDRSLKRSNWQQAYYYAELVERLNDTTAGVIAIQDMDAKTEGYMTAFYRNVESSADPKIDQIGEQMFNETFDVESDTHKAAIKNYDIAYAPKAQEMFVDVMSPPGVLGGAYNSIIGSEESDVRASPEIKLDLGYRFPQPTTEMQTYFTERMEFYAPNIKTPEDFDHFVNNAFRDLASAFKVSGVGSRAQWIRNAPESYGMTNSAWVNDDLEKSMNELGYSMRTQSTGFVEQPDILSMSIGVIPILPSSENFAPKGTVTATSVTLEYFDEETLARPDDAFVGPIPLVTAPRYQVRMLTDDGISYLKMPGMGPNETVLFGGLDTLDEYNKRADKETAAHTESMRQWKQRGQAVVDSISQGVTVLSKANPFAHGTP